MTRRLPATIFTGLHIAVVQLLFLEMYFVLKVKWTSQFLGSSRIETEGHCLKRRLQNNFLL